MITPSSDVQLLLDLLGIFAFALSGGLVGVRAHLDLFGITVLAWCAGLGGGIIRDLLLGDTPPVGISDPRYVTTVLIAGLAVFALHGLFIDLRARRPSWRLGSVAHLVRIFDAVGLAVFAVSGAMKAIDWGAPWLACIVVGLITAVGGGMVRDILAGRVPEVLRQELYAVPAIVGAAIVVLADRIDVLNLWVVWLAVLIVFSARILAISFDLHIPTAIRRGAGS